jgi:hypothetical protein
MQSTIRSPDSHPRSRSCDHEAIHSRNERLEAFAFRYGRMQHATLCIAVDEERYVERHYSSRHTHRPRRPTTWHRALRFRVEAHSELQVQSPATTLHSSNGRWIKTVDGRADPFACNEIAIGIGSWSFPAIATIHWTSLASQGWSKIWLWSTVKKRQSLVQIDC